MEPIKEDDKSQTSVNLIYPMKGMSWLHNIIYTFWRSTEQKVNYHRLALQGTLQMSP